MQGRRRHRGQAPQFDVGERPEGSGLPTEALGETDPADEFWGVREDARSVAAFIRIWLTENRRWNSPKYLLGESYGTTRIGALMGEMEAGWNDVSVNGVALISTVLDFSTDDTSPGNDTGYVGLMPGYAAAAWYHEKVDRSAWGGDYDRFLREARDFATDEYLPALIRGHDNSEAAREQVISRLSDFIGLSEDYIRRANMRVTLSDFRVELLREQGLHVGRFDARFTGVEPDGVADSPEGDPSGYGIDGGYTAAMMDYFTRDLGVDIVEPYTTLGGVRQWNWDSGRVNDRMHVNVSPWLERAMRQNADLRVLVHQTQAGLLRLSGEAAGARACGERHLCSRHALLRHRDDAQPARLRSFAHRADLLRGRPHDVPAPALDRGLRRRRAPLHRGRRLIRCGLRPASSIKGRRASLLTG